MATAAGESPTTTNGFCSPAFDMTGIEQRVAIALTATRLRITGGIDIMLPHRKADRVVRLRVIELEGLGGGGSLLLTHATSVFSVFHVKNVRWLREGSHQ